MKLTKYIEGSDADDHTCELADMSLLTDRASAGISWSWENWWPESQVGELYIALEGLAAANSPPVVYGLNITPEEFGALLASTYRSADFQAVMSGFLARAALEVVGAMVGLVITHLAQRRIAAEPVAAADGGRDPGSS